MTGTQPMTSKSARLRARQRRLELDASRDEQDQREEQAAAAVLDVLTTKAKVETELGALTRQAGEALRRLIDQGASLDRAAALVELDATEVRRLMKLATAENGGRSPGSA